ncbi:MAG: GerAB/ArcD/ProY family transporter [Thermoanaerobacteraceae bacterium]
MINKIENTSEKKISIKQFSYLLITIVISTADIFLPSYVALIAKQDSWISVIIASLTSIIIFFFYYKLSMLFKKETLFSYVNKITGKVISKFISLLYLLFLLHGITIIMREIIEIIKNVFMPNTPETILYIFLVLPVAYAVSKGFLAITRMTEILFPYGIILLIFVISLSLPKIDMSNFLPVLENGIKPPLLGSIPILSYTLETIIILLIFPYIHDQNKTLKYGIISIITLTISLSFGVLAIGVFGAKTTSNFQFAALEMVRNIRVSNYIQRFDSLVMALWIMGIYLKITIFTYLFVKGFATTIKSYDYRYLVLPVSSLIIPLSENISESLDGLYTYVQRFFPFEALVFEILIPLILYIIAKLKKIK